MDNQTKQLILLSSLSQATTVSLVEARCYSGAERVLSLRRAQINLAEMVEKMNELTSIYGDEL